MDLLAPLGPVYQAGTLSGNPLAMAAGIATVSYLQEHAARSIRALRQRRRLSPKELRPRQRKAGVPLTLNRVGAMWTWFFNPGPVTNYERPRSPIRRPLGAFTARCWSRVCGCRLRSLKRLFWAPRTERPKCRRRLKRRELRLRQIRAFAVLHYPCLQRHESMRALVMLEQLADRTRMDPGWHTAQGGRHRGAQCWLHSSSLIAVNLADQCFCDFVR